MKCFLAFILSCITCSAQFGGPDLPFFAGAAVSNSPCSLNIPGLPGVKLFADINRSLATDKWGSSFPTNNDPISTWTDVSGFSAHLQNAATTPGVRYLTTGGPTNGPCISFDYDISGSYLTNKTINSGFTIDQAITVFMVVNDPGCCNADHAGALFDSSINSTTNEFTIVALHPDIGISGQVMATTLPATLYDGRSGDGSSTFGWAFDTWAVYTFQFNQSFSHVYINGNGPLFTTHYGPLYNPGNGGLNGITLAAHRLLNQRFRKYKTVAVLIVSGNDILVDANRQAVERAFGCEFSITVN